VIKFTVLATEHGGIEMWRGHAVQKNLLHWALEAHVHKNAYGTLIDMTLYELLDAGKSITWASGRGLGCGNLDFFGPQMALA
jgi:hypothetical protein